MESNCRKLVSACVQLGKPHHLHRGPLPGRCAAGRAARRGCSAARRRASAAARQPVPRVPPCPQGCSRPTPRSRWSLGGPSAPLRGPGGSAALRALLRGTTAPSAAAQGGRWGGCGCSSPKSAISAPPPAHTAGLGFLALPCGPQLPSPRGRHPPGAGTSRAPFWGAGWASPRGGKAKQQCKHITKKKTSALYSERLFNPR